MRPESLGILLGFESRVLLSNVELEMVEYGSVAGCRYLYRGVCCRRVDGGLSARRLIRRRPVELNRIIKDEVENGWIGATIGHVYVLCYNLASCLVAPLAPCQREVSFGHAMASGILTEMPWFGEASTVVDGLIRANMMAGSGSCVQNRGFEQATEFTPKSSTLG